MIMPDALSQPDALHIAALSIIIAAAVVGIIALVSWARAKIDGGGEGSVVSRLTKPGTLLDSSPAKLAVLFVGGFLIAQYAPKLTDLFFLVGLPLLAVSTGLAGWLAFDRYFVKYDLAKIIEEKNVAGGLIYLSFGMIIAAGVLGSAIIGITMIKV